MPVPEFHVCYGAVDNAVAFKGAQINDPETFRLYLIDSVRARLEDAEQFRSFSDDLRGLVTTDMASETLAGLLSAAPDHEPWQVGEALAECLLQDAEGAIWPWNAERDKRTPRASLPGADLVGFLRAEGQVYLLLGEVKTSSELRTPPNVMSGRSGMIHQLDQLATAKRIHFSLLKWLHVRCQHTDFQPLYEEAVGNYLRSGGKLLVLYGLLMRDTAPAEADLASRASSLATKVEIPTSVSLHAWYLPSPIDAWPALLRSNA